MEPDRTLILMDTNKARSTLSGSPRYDSFDFGTDFNELKSFIDENNLSGSVIFAITEMTLKELLSQKNKVYDTDIENLNSAVSRLLNLENVSIPDIKLPDNSFDFISYLTPKVETFLQENNIEIIKIEEDNKASVLDVLIQKVIDVEPPFKSGKSSSSSGHGFKDAVILETFKQCTTKNNFTNVILFTGDSDFDDCEKEVEGINFKIIKSKEFLIQDLKSKYAAKLLEKEYEELIQNPYLITNLKQLIASEVNSTEDKVVIISLTEKIIDDPVELKEKFSSLNQDAEYFENMVCFVCKVRVEDSEYIIDILIDLGSNEIETIQVEAVS
ncbi:MAG: PIN domain-containing protein [Nitrosopumilaceae archaeon]